MAEENNSQLSTVNSQPRSNIDLVVPMVFPNDTAWQQKYAMYHGNDATRNVRFRSWGTEELLVKCIMKYMPWLRYIHILLDSESQMGSLPLTLPTVASSPIASIPRLPKGKGVPEVRFVFHRDFIPEEHLPCFSSPCIEMFLHRIPDLAEHFIYINDDMFPLSPLKAEDFFQTIQNSKFKIQNDGGEEMTNGQCSMVNGFLPCQVVGEKPYPASPNTFHRACMDGLNMVAAPFGKKWTKTYLKNGHSFAPLLKSSCEEVWRRHGEQILAHLSPLSRKPDSYNQYLYVYYQHLAGLYVEHTPRLQYVGTGASVERIKEAIRDPEAGVVCLNDNEAVQDWEQRAALVRREIAAKVMDDREKGPQVLIVHYNTPELTEAAILSLWKHTPNAHVTVFDNSDRRPFRPFNDNVNVNDNKFSILNSQFSIIDNTQGQIVDWKKWLATFPDKIPTPENMWGSAKHCYSVEMCLDRFPDGFILMDSDVLIKKDVSQLMDRTVPWKGGVHVNTRRFGVDIPRVMPFLCWINTPMLRQHGIRYFNHQKMWNLVSSFPDRHYDTGAWLLEACNNAGLQGRRVEIKTWMEHYGHGSWHDGKSPESWLRMYRNLWYDAKAAQAAVHSDNAEKVRIYVCTHTDFNPVVKNPVYEVVDARKYNGDVCDNGLRGSFYSELILYKYIAERDDLPEYVGCCGYRKYFSFMDNVPDIPALFGQYDAIAAMPVRVSPNVRGQYARCHNVKDLDIVSDIIQEHLPDLWPTFDRSLRMPELYACNMFILRRQDFREVVAQVFDILDRYLQVAGMDIEARISANPDDYHIGMNAVSTPQYQYRIGGFLGERIINAILRHRFHKIMHYKKVMTGKAR